jgi:hypothetical protein
MRSLFCGLLVSLLLTGNVHSNQAKDLRAEIERLQKKIELLAGEEVRRETEPGVLAAFLGHDPEKIFAVVRGLDFHPYRGALRGAQGTLLAGAGNDADRCLLLQDLLERAPVKPNLRFAFGELTAEQGGALAARALRSVPARSSALPATDDGLLAKVGETEESLAAAGEVALKSASAHLRRVSRGFAADRASVGSALKEAGVALSGLEADRVTSRAVALRDHVWLQVERAGKWIDLDPSFPDAVAGWAPVPAARTAPALPPGIFHRVGLRLVVERRSGAALETEVIYSGTRNTAEMAGRAIHVTVMPSGFDVARFSQSLEAQAEKFERFQPVVTLGGSRENARVFDIHGQVFQSKDGKFGADSGAVVGTRVFGGLSKKPPTSFSAIRLEIETISPGEPARTAVRSLLDRLRPGSREAGKPDWDAAWQDEIRFRVALFQAWSIWPATGMLNDAFLVERLATLLARHGGIPALLLDHVEKKRAVSAAEVGERMDPLPLGLIGMAQSALLLSQGELDPGEGLVFAERPSILIWKEAIAPGKKNEVTWRGGVDLALAPLGIIAKNPAEAARARFAYGLLLTEGESSLMEEGKGSVVSAAVRFRRAREANVPLRVLRGEVKGVTLDPRTELLVAGELRTGRVVVIPKEPVGSGGARGTAWWRVDPESGECLGVGDTGEGQAVSEGVLILDNISIPMVERCMKFVICLNVGVGMGGASMQDAGRECMVEFMKDFVKDTLDNAIKEFIPQKFRDPAAHYEKEAARTAENMMKDTVDPEYWALYQKAKKCYGATKELQELGGLRKRVEMLLKFGHEIAKYSNEKMDEARKNR